MQRLPEKHYGHHQHTNDDEELLQCALSVEHVSLATLAYFYELGIGSGFLKKHHVDEGDQEIGSTVLRVDIRVLVDCVRVVMGPLEEYQEYQIAEDKKEKYDLKSQTVAIKNQLLHHKQQS